MGLIDDRLLQGDYTHTGKKDGPAIAKKELLVHVEKELLPVLRGSGLIVRYINDEKGIDEPSTRISIRKDEKGSQPIHAIPTFVRDVRTRNGKPRLIIPATVRNNFPQEEWKRQTLLLADKDDLYYLVVAVNEILSKARSYMFGRYADIPEKYWYFGTSKPLRTDGSKYITRMGWNGGGGFYFVEESELIDLIKKTV
jgi:hypothetical protein